MNRVAVELTGTSPMLHNRCWSDGSGWQPMNDHEQAESRLHVSPSGRLCLPYWAPVVAIGRAAWSRDRDSSLPTEIVEAANCSRSLRAWPVKFIGDWMPQVFLRKDFPPVALPRFDVWSASFTLEFNPRFYAADQLRGLLEFSGRRLGLPTFAPFAGPGPWGLFKVSAWDEGERSSARRQAVKGSA